MEHWKKYKETNTYISDEGNVFTLSKTGKHIHRKPSLHTKGYLKISIGKENISMHRIVAQLFLEPNDLKPHVNHKDFNKANNHVDNLEWCTVDENNDHAQQHNKGSISKPYVVITKNNEFIAEFKSQNLAFKYKINKKGLICVDKKTYLSGYKYSKKPNKKRTIFIKSTNRLLSDAQVLEIKELFLNPEYYDYRIANMYGVNSGTIRCIREGKGYSDVVKK